MPDEENQEETQDERIQRPGADEKKAWSLTYIKKSPARMRRRLAELRVMIAEGMTDEEIVGKTGVEYETLLKLKDEIYKQDRAAVSNADPVSIFVRYCLQQEGIIIELNRLLGGWIRYFRYAQCRTYLLTLDSWIREVPSYSIGYAGKEN